MNPKNITHAASMPGEKRERESDNRGTGGGTIFDFLEPQKNKMKQRKTFHGCSITEEEDEEGSLKEDKRTRHLLDCCHQG